MIERKTLKVRIKFEEELLGTCSGNPNLHSDYIASKAPTHEMSDEEVAAIEELDERKTMTVFPRDDNGKPFLYDYQIKGFFKDATQALKKVNGTHAQNVKAYKKEIDGLLFVTPRKIVLNIPDGEEIGRCQRPLRGSTPMGERISLSDSETCPAGTTCEFEIVCLTDSMMKLAKECLTYGILRGIGQWRNSGKGRFSYDVILES